MATTTPHPPESFPERALLAIGFGIATPIAWITATRARLGWAACIAAAVATVALMAFGGVREDPWWLTFVAILATPTSLAVLILWWRENHPAEITQEPDEDSAGKPIDWGVGSALPPDAFTF